MFVSRRAYLRKAGMVNFEGICSNVTFTIKGIEGKIVNKLLPFIMQSEAFVKQQQIVHMDQPIHFLIGKTLQLEFAPPPLEEQKRLLNFFKD